MTPNLIKFGRSWIWWHQMEDNLFDNIKVEVTVVDDTKMKDAEVDVTKVEET